MASTTKINEAFFHLDNALQKLRALEGIDKEAEEAMLLIIHLMHDAILSAKADT